MTSESTPSYASAVTSSGAEDVDVAYEDALDDVHTRFLLNLPDAELSSPDRIFFQLEQAWWFYDDMICDRSKLDLPRFKTLKPFAVKMFEISPILQPLRKDFDKLWQRFAMYKRGISVYGTILLNQDCTKVVLCQVWNSPSWTFPAGKVNQNEAGIDAAARETYEETGFDPNCQLGLTATLQAAGQVPWSTPLKEEDGLVFVDGGKRRTNYVTRGVPMDFPFAPVARKEVGKVAWHDLDDIPKKSFAVLPYLGQLRRWIKKHTNNKHKSTPRRTTPKSRSRSSSRGKVRADEDVVKAGLASPGQDKGWAEEDMFAAHEKLSGRKITYDGSPHHFSEMGFDGMDPHAFHLVGGEFMNSGISKLAPAPHESKLQPLFRNSNEYDEDNGDERELQPFFSIEGETPWGTNVKESIKTTNIVQSNPPNEMKSISSSSAEVNAGKALLSMLQSSGNNAKAAVEASSEADTIFLTDAQITAQSQREKTSSGSTASPPSSRNQEEPTEPNESNAQEWIREWVTSLPQPPATKRFGDFRFDVDRILQAMDAPATPSNV